MTYIPAALPPKVSQVDLVYSATKANERLGEGWDLFSVFPVEATESGPMVRGKHPDAQTFAYVLVKRGES